MTCKFTWFNLPNEIRTKIGQPLEQFLTSTTKKKISKLSYFNLAETLNDIQKDIIAQNSECVTTSFQRVTFFNVINILETICKMRDEIIEC